jgi:hypothetical protein
MRAKFWALNLKGRDHVGDLGVDGRVIFNWRGIGFENMDWIELAQDKDQCAVIVNTVMNLGFPGRWAVS